MFRLLSRLPGQAEQAFRRNNFDALRLIFASMVVLFHAALLSEHPSLALLKRHVSAAFAVQAFFVVSGFLVAMSCERSASFGSYFQKRLRRIVPAYVVVVTGAAVLLCLVSILSPVEYFSSREFWRYLGFNLILSNFSAPALPGVFDGNLERAVNGSLWTIKIEMGFYLALPVILWIAGKLGWRRTFSAVFIASIAWRVGLQWAEGVMDAPFLGKLAKQLPGQLSFFIGGSWAYFRLKEGRLPKFLPALAGLVGYVLLSGLVHDVIAPLAVSAMVSWAALSAPQLPKVGVYGDFSYGTYLYHFPVAQVLISAGIFQVSGIAGLLALIVIVGVMSVLSWRYIESPWLPSRKSGEK